MYATAHLSGDVANAVTLLKRMTRPASRKHKAGLLVSSEELAACQVGLPLLQTLSNRGFYSSSWLRSCCIKFASHNLSPVTVRVPEGLLHSSLQI